jgi:protein-tyrosine phosphatase
MGIIYTRRLPLESVCNARDLGGYPLAGGGRTRYGVFVRSARPCNVTEQDLKFLKEYGIKTSLDFRSVSETNKWPSTFQLTDWIDYRLKSLDVKHVIITPNNSTGIADSVFEDDEHMTWPEVYIMMTEKYRPWFREIIDIAANCEGTLHYNCTTGKDRTGIVSALLLGIAGAYEEDIIADYCVSQVYLESVFRELIEDSVKWASSLDMENVFFKTSPDNMYCLIKHMNEKYGGILGYIDNIGVSSKSVEKIRKKFVEYIF